MHFVANVSTCRYVLFVERNRTLSWSFSSLVLQQRPLRAVHLRGLRRKPEQINFPDEATCLSVCRCPRLTCDKECEYGAVFDKSGCPTCECLGNPCAVSMSQRCDRMLKHKVYACQNQAQ